MKYVITFSLNFMLLFLQFDLQAQIATTYTKDEYVCLYKIDSLYKSQLYDSSIIYINRLLRATSIIENDRPLLLKLFYNYKQKGNLDSARKYLFNALDYGLDCINDTVDADATIIPNDYLIFDKKTNAEIITKISVNNIFHKNDSLLKKITELIKYDQVVRGTSNPEYLKGINNPDSVRKKYLQVDSMNLLRVKMILHNYGWPGFKQLGWEGDNYLWTLVQHADNDVYFQLYALKLIEGSLLYNETNKRNYAYLYDRICVNLGRPQLFGTQIKYADSSQFQLYPLQDSLNLKYYRYAFSLSPIEKYIKYYKEHYHLKR